MPEDQPYLYRADIRKLAKYKQIGGARFRLLPPVERLHELFIIDPVTGRLFDRPKALDRKNAEAFNKNHCGLPIGSIHAKSAGYRTIYFDAFCWAEHRVIWKMHTGCDPAGMIDHINGVRDDNRIENLRDVTPQENAWNAIRGRWRLTTAQRKAAKAAANAAAKLERANRRETRELAQLARLKAKYERKQAIDRMVRVLNDAGID